MLSFAPKEPPEVLRRLRDVAQKAVEGDCGGDAVATVASLPCREPGCPPWETFVQVLSGQWPVSFRLKKRPSEVSDAELLQALRFALAAAKRQGVDDAASDGHDASGPPPPPLPRPPATFMRTPDGRVGVDALRRVVREVVEAQPAIDVHTHLFPPSRAARRRFTFTSA